MSTNSFWEAVEYLSLWHKAVLFLPIEAQKGESLLIKPNYPNLV